MKAKLILLGITLLLQSCFTYKQLEPNQENLIVGNKYKLKHLEYGKFKKGKVITLNDSILTYKISNGRLDGLRIDGIQEIKKGEFSLGKTIILPVSMVAGSFVLFLVAVGKSGVGIGEIDLGF